MKKNNINIEYLLIFISFLLGFSLISYSIFAFSTDHYQNFIDFKAENPNPIDENMGVTGIIFWIMPALGVEMLIIGTFMLVSVLKLRDAIYLQEVKK